MGGVQDAELPSGTFFSLLFACYTNWLFIIRLRATTNTNHQWSTTSHTNTQTMKGGRFSTRRRVPSHPLLSQQPLPPQHSMMTSGARWRGLMDQSGWRLQVSFYSMIFFKFFHLLPGLCVAQVCLVFDLPRHENILEQGSIQYLFNPYINVDTFTLFSNQISTFSDIAN